MKLSEQAKIFKALGNEQRLRIFMMIYEGCCTPDQAGRKGSCSPSEGAVEKAFSKVCNCLDLSRSTISHHYKELQNAGLITCERQGQSFCCRVNEKAVQTITELLG